MSKAGKQKKTSLRLGGLWVTRTTSGVPMRSLKHFEVADLTRMGNGRNTSNGFFGIVIDMMDGIYGVRLWMEIDTCYISVISYVWIFYDIFLKID